LRGDALVEAVRDYSILVAMRERTTFDAALLNRLPRLELLITTGMSNAAIDISAADALGITVCGTRGLTSATVEMTWALILAAVRRIPEETEALRAGRWQTTLGLGLRRRTLGVLGLGRYGAEVARVGQAFGMKVIAWSQHLTQARVDEVGVELVSKPQLFTRSDVLSIHYRLGPRSALLVGRAELALMQPHAVLVNTSREQLVDVEALAEALQSGRLGAAAVDVFADEPPTRAHPLLHTPRTVATPHLGYVTDDNYSVFYTDAVKCIAGYVAGSPVRVLGQVGSRRTVSDGTWPEPV
jgi:phosphoglycerate dehydrogenase-like enzyme